MIESGVGLEIQHSFMFEIICTSHTAHKVHIVALRFGGIGNDAIATAQNALKVCDIFVGYCRIVATFHRITILVCECVKQSKRMSMFLKCPNFGARLLLLSRLEALLPCTFECSALHWHVWTIFGETFCGVLWSLNWVIRPKLV